MRKTVLLVFSAMLLAATIFLINRSTNTSSRHFAIVKPVEQTPFEQKEENEQDGIRERNEQEIAMTMDPALGSVPVERLLIAEDRAAKLARMSKVEDMQALTWTERGPSNMGGRSRAILIDKNDATGNTVFIGSAGGGLWRTTNFKAATPAWTQIATVSANLAITTLAQDPATLNTMYAGTGEGYSNVDAIRGLGIYKSTDGGLTWSLLASTTTGGANVSDMNFIQKILVYTNGDVYVAGISRFCNRGGILKSTNGGSTWTRVVGTSGASCAASFDLLGFDIEMSAGGDMYASVQDYSVNDTTIGKVFRSPAGATVGNSGTWVNVTPPPPALSGSYWQRIELACSPTNNNKIYALMQGMDYSVGGISVSSNAGSSWTTIDNTTMWCDQGSATTTDFSRDQAWYDLAIAIKPDDDQTVFVGGVDLMKTTNGGTSWVQATQWAAGCAALPSIHADNHNIAYFPGSPTEFIVVNDGGIYYTSNNGTSFTNKSAGYRTIQYYSAAIHPTAGSNYMLAGAQDNGTHKFSAAGLGSVTTATGGDGGFCGIDLDNPNYQYTAYTNATYQISSNGGASFAINANFGGGGGRFINPTDYASTQNIIYAGYAPAQLLRINNITAAITANTLSFLASGVNPNSQVSAVKVDPNTANRVWVAFSGDQVTAPQLFYVNSANGASPVTNTITLPAAIAAGQYISNIDIESGDANHILVTVSNYGVASIYESTNLGAAWTSLDNNGVNLPDMPVRWGMFIPAGVAGFSGRVQAVSGIMIATELGVWTATTRSGLTTVWTQSSGLPNVRVDMLTFRSSDRTVVAATHGRGLFTTNLSTTLPVVLMTFTGQLDNSTALLNWSTSAEYNSKDFYVEKSGDGTNYTKIGTISASGNSSSEKKYSFRDMKPSATNFYRIRMNDLDGESKLTNVVTLKYNEPGQNLMVRNTPFENYIDLKFAKPAAKAKVQLLNASGMLMAERSFSNPWGELHWDLPSHLSPGGYLVRAEIDGEVFVIKTVKK